MDISKVYIIANIIVFLSWLLFWIGFLTQPRRGKHEERVRDSRSIIGIIIEGIGFAIVFSVHWDISKTDNFIGILPRILIYSVAAILAPVSVWLALWAIKTLGKQWSLTARTLVSHELITSGPYRIVRHPIYTAMFGLLLATGILITHPAALIPAIIIFIIGTQLRIRSEEKLLIDVFGDQYTDYRKKVNAIIPYLW